jgi:hypothetical protein
MVWHPISGAVVSAVINAVINGGGTMTPAGLRRVSIVCSALFALAAVGAAEAQLAEWNQDRVSAIAKEFAEKAGAVYTEVYRNQVTNTIGSGQSKDYARLKDKARLIRSESRRLARQLDKGKDRVETQPSYERMMVEIRDAREIARRLNLGEPLLNKIGAAGDALRRLSPYYDPKSNQNPEAPADS